MIRVLFFARLREQLDTDATELEAAPATVAEARARLVEAGGPRWRSVLEEDNIIAAVNQEVVSLDAPLRDGDELAFFPPVTGG